MTNKSKFRFTQRAIDALPPHRADSPSKSAEYSDTEVVGLRLSVNKLGRKFFYFRFTFNGQKRAMKIGEYPALSIVDARKKALEMRSDIDSGIDPTAERDRIRGTPTFRDFALNDYMEWARGSKRSWKTDDSKLRNHLVPRFGDRRLCDITLRDVQLYHAQVKQSHCAGTANRHLSVISKLFKCAIQWGIVERNPCVGVKKFPENNARQRFLSPDEIRRLFKAMDKQSGRSVMTIAALKFLLLTGARRNEALTARWENVDLERGTWFIPHTKSGRSHHVPLNEEAKALLENLPKVEGSPWVFPGRDPAKHVIDPRKCLDSLMDEAGIERIRIHDLRHSFASLCAQSGASLYLIKQLLNHADMVTTQRYAHLTADNLREASQQVSAVISDALKANRQETAEA
ncbi:tyrosine-type recombinase/integrase [Comamonas aquatica]|uniref:tyrosine-type recombinase/integrase n=1 Tax=Comamonas aquatica TaxID=225991 RepID=UPI0021B0D42C|nr:site-specific integrase [Comamonas aquatica]